MLMEQARMRKQAEPAQAATPEAAPAAGQYKAPDWRALTPQESHDAVERVVAAGAKLMYSPDFRDDLKQAVATDMPVDQKLADNVVGLLLMLDQQAQGGIPIAALFPAGVALMDEAAQVLGAAGQQVTQEDFDGATMRLFTLMSQKMGASDDDIMKAAGDAMPDDAAPGGAVAANDRTSPAGDELAAMKEGMA